MSTDLNINAIGQNRPVERVNEKSQPREPQVQEVEVVNEQDLDSVVQDINSAIQSINKELRFTVDKDLGETIVQVRDKTTDEVLRQIPAEQMLAMRKSIEENIRKGLVFNESG